MKLLRRVTFGISIAVVLIIAGNFYWKNLRGIGPALTKPTRDITKAFNATGMPLALPAGFAIEIFADSLPGARVMEFDKTGNLWVSQTSVGTISRLEIADGAVKAASVIYQHLRKPHGLAFDQKNPFTLYVAEEHQISNVDVRTDGPFETIASLPSGGGHFTRTLAFGQDDRLYVSIGSSCNVCVEADSRRAKIFSLARDGTDFKEFARGLRNTVFFAWHPKTGDLWGTDMGRDLLGDDVPPDEINVIRSPAAAAGQPQIPNFGWPNCYGKNIHDTEFDKNIYIRNPCMEPFELSSHIDIQAHSAPLGLAFIPQGSNWPKEYWNDLLIAYHGSWNRSVPTGYKIVRMKLDERGNHLGTEDFITGWLTDAREAIGRPVDIRIRENGDMFVSDDKAGVIYRVTPLAEK